MSRSTIEIRDAVRSGALKATDSIADAIRQIRKVEPELHAASQVFETEALERAAEIDRRVAARLQLQAHKYIWSPEARGV